MKAMRQGVIASLEAEKKKRGAEGTDTSAIEAIEPKLLKIGPVSLAPSTEQGKSSGLTFHYSPYAVGSYAEGGYVAFVPWETLKPYLTPEGARDFRRRAAEGRRRPANNDGRAPVRWAGPAPFRANASSPESMTGTASASARHPAARYRASRSIR